MNHSSSMSSEWKYALALPMVAAVAVVVYGALPALRAPTDGGTFGLDNLFRMLIWWYGLVGVALCYLGQAAFRVPLGLGSVAGSAGALLYSAMRGAAPDHSSYTAYPIGPDGNMLFLLACLAGSVLVVWIDWRRRAAATESPPVFHSIDIDQVSINTTKPECLTTHGRYHGSGLLSATGRHQRRIERQQTPGLDRMHDGALGNQAAQERDRIDWRRPYRRARRTHRDQHQQADRPGSPMLAQTCACGKTIPKAKLEMLRADGNGEPIKYFEVELENVLIGHLAASFGGDFPTESLGLKFSKVRWKYTQQKIAGGSTGNTAGGWDLATNRIA